VLIFLPYLNLAVLGLIFPIASAKYHDYNRLDKNLRLIQWLLTNLYTLNPLFLLTLNSQDCGAFNNLGNCYDRLEKTTEAIEAYSKAIELDKDYIAAVYNRGNAF
jgi:tetratricopeptide (TPR) repeat protein